MFDEINTEFRGFLDSVIGLKDQPDFLYHYTSQKVLESILRNGELWLSNIHDMNDPLETFYGIDVLLRICDQFTSRDLEEIKEVIEAYRSTGRLDGYQTYERPTYVFSLSSLEDNIYNWMSYADTGNGVSLEFNRVELFQEIGKFLRGLHETEPFIVLFPVLYLDIDNLLERNADQLLIEQIVLFLEELVGQIRSSGQKDLIKPLIFEILMTVSAFIKHKFHQAEEEWRIVVFTRGPGNLESVDCIVNGSLKTVFKLKFQETLVPALERSFSNLSRVLQSVRLGPKVAGTSAKNAIGTLTYKNWAGSRIQVWSSSGKLRPS